MNLSIIMARERGGGEFNCASRRLNDKLWDGQTDRQCVMCCLPLRGLPLFCRLFKGTWYDLMSIKYGEHVVGGNGLLLLLWRFYKSVY